MSGREVEYGPDDLWKIRPAYAITIHKSQGSQWEQVQVISSDLAVAAGTGRIESGQPLWKRLTYVAITRAQLQLNWVTRNRLSKPKIPLDTTKLI